MLKPLIRFLLSVLPISLPVALQTAAALPPSACGDPYCNSHGWVRIASPSGEGYLSGFSPEINGGYASLGAGGLISGKQVEIQIDFLSRSGIHTCKVPMVVVDFRESKSSWSAFRVGNATFGSCTIAQRFENGRTVWKGEMTAHLVRVQGDVENGSPRRLHSEKDAVGQPITKTIELSWELDKFPKRP
jgi:hypothetical protein